MLKGIGEKSLFKDRAKRKIANARRKEEEKVRNLRASLVADLTHELSERNIIIRNVLDIVDSLVEKGWTKKEFQKRKWSL